MNREQTVKYRYWRLTLGVLVLLFSGIIYAWSTISRPFIDFGWTKPQLQLNFTITMGFFCIGGFVSGLISKKVSAFIRIGVSAVLTTAGLIIVSFLNKGSSVFWLYFAYGFMMGTGVGVVYNVVISATNSWFPDRKGLSSGAQLMAFGLGAFFIGLVADKMFEMPSIGWENTYRIFGIVIGIIMFTAAIFVKSPPTGTVFPQRKGAKPQSAVNYETKDVIKRPTFWMLFVFFMLFASVGSTAIADAKNMMTELGVVKGLTAIALLVPVCNSFGRIASGLFFDSFGLRKTQYLTSGVVILATGISLVSFVTDSLVLGIVGLFLCGFSYGFAPTMSAAFTAEFYGLKNFALNFSLLNLILIPASFAPTLSAMLVSSYESYIPTFIILTSISFVGLFINLGIKRS
ncbi:MAG: OFA family MFS transporter [Clostridiales bacterium]|jgi:OFA family oxalate/formate antiporter-like MFS transporter|nr:OFA family MFS transporter [Clostridiales bacterium]